MRPHRESEAQGLRRMVCTLRAKWALCAWGSELSSTFEAMVFRRAGNIANLDAANLSDLLAEPHKKK